VCANAAETAAITMLTFLRLSVLVARGNNRTTDTQCAMQPCFRIADTCSVAAHANGLPLCASATASSKFCVSELPWWTFTEARRVKKTTSWTV